MASIFSLHWRQTSHPPAHPLPPSIKRSLVTTPTGQFEFLTAQPTNLNSNLSLPTLFFLHGGFGCATVWLPWMAYFQERGFSCYAVSLRGHGQSWQPGYWRMTRGTTFHDLVDDVRSAWHKALRLEERKGRTERFLPVFIAHSSGGGIAQYVLSECLVRTSALVLCAAIPGFGSSGVYWN